MTTMAGIGGLVGGLSGLFGANASSVQPPQSMVPPQYQLGAATSAYGGMQNFQNVYGNLGQSTLPYAQNIFSNLYNNPYAGNAVTGANVGGQMGMNAATNAYGAGNQLTQSGTAMLPYATQIMTAAMDPQSQLYAQMAAQTQNAANATNAAAGLSTSPYGAAATGAAMGNFNTQWANNLLNRYATGAQAAGNLVNQAGGAIGQGTGIAYGAGGGYANAAAMPYATYTGIGQNQQGALGNLQGSYGTAANLDNMSIQDWLAYLGAGNAANQTANQQFQTLLNQNQLANQQTMMFGSALGGGLRMLGGGTAANSPVLGPVSSWSI